MIEKAESAARILEVIIGWVKLSYGWDLGCSTEESRRLQQRNFRSLSRCRGFTSRGRHTALFLTDVAVSQRLSSAARRSRCSRIRRYPSSCIAEGVVQRSRALCSFPLRFLMNGLTACWTMFDHNAGVEVFRQAGHFLHPLKPPHYLLVLTLSLHTPEVEFQLVTRTS